MLLHEKAYKQGRDSCLDREVRNPTDSCGIAIPAGLPFPRDCLFDQTERLHETWIVLSWKRRRKFGVVQSTRLI